MINKEILIEINNDYKIKFYNKNNELNKYLRNNYIYDVKLFSLKDNTNIFELKKYLKKYNINYKFLLQ